MLKVKKSRTYFVVSVLLVISLVVSLPMSANAVDCQNYEGIDCAPLISINDSSSDGQETRAQSNSVKLTGSRQISWTLANSWATIGGIYIYDNDVLVADVSGIVSGTTFYIVPSGSLHVITMKCGAVTLASCSG